jgi:hypothetical protein
VEVVAARQVWGGFKVHRRTFELYGCACFFEWHHKERERKNKNIIKKKQQTTE